MADGTLQYKIEILGDGAKVIRETTKAIQESKQATQESNVVKLSETEVNKILAKSEEEAKEQKKGLIDQLKILKHEIPGLGEAIHLLKNPYVALAIVVGMAITKLKEYNQQVADAKKETEDFDNALAEASKRGVAHEEMLGVLTKYAGAMAAIAENANTADTRLKEILGTLQTQAKAAEEARKALEELAKEQIALDEAEGEITPLEAQRRRIGLAQSGAAAGRAASMQQAAAEEFAVHAARSQTEAHRGAAEAALPGALAALEAAKQHELQRAAETALLKSGGAELIMQRAKAETAAAQQSVDDLQQKILSDTKRIQELTADEKQRHEALDAQWKTAQVVGAAGAQTAAAQAGAAAVGSVNKLGPEVLGLQGQIGADLMGGRGVVPAIAEKYKARESELVEALGAILNQKLDVSEEMHAMLRQIGGRVRALENQIQNVQHP